MNIRAPRIGFAGMTHLGLVSAVASAEKGFGTTCFDTNSALVDQLRRHDFPIAEPQLSELAAKNRDRLFFTDDRATLDSCDVIYVSPDVRTDDKGQSDLTDVQNLLKLARENAGADAAIVVLSQVPPGFTRPHGEADKRIYYQVETLIFGHAVARALGPERYIVGCRDPRNPLPKLFAAYLGGFGCPLLQMRYESAELAKIAINCCLVATISAANTLAELCEHIGADWSEIIPALRLDRRIGEYAYLVPGLGIAGGNLERDLATVCDLAARNGTDSGVVQAWIANSQYRKNWVLRTLHQEVLVHDAHSIIAVLGLAYKPDTHSIKNSPSLALLENIQPFTVRIYDPVVKASTVAHPHLTETTSIEEACRGADAVVLMTPWEQIRSQDPARAIALMKGRTIIDPYQAWEAKSCIRAGAHYFTLGRGGEQP